jgi:hypothetical protein
MNNNIKLITLSNKNRYPIKNLILHFFSTNNNNNKKSIKEIHGLNFNDINNIKPNKNLIKLHIQNTYSNQENIYNKIVQIVIDKIRDFLLENETFFNNKIDLIREKCKESIMFNSLNNLNKFIGENSNTLSYKKLYYILFWYLGITRHLIYILQNSDTSKISFFFSFNDIKSSMYGYSDVFNRYTYFNRHPLSMNRFKKYMLRLLYNCLICLNYKKNNYINDGIAENININKIIIKKNNVVNENTIKNQIIIKNKGGIATIYSFILFNGKYSIDKNTYLENNYFYNYDNVNGNGNYPENYPEINIKKITLKNKCDTFILIFENFKSLDTEVMTISQKKKCIIKIYYYIIILMPFQLGTASIAEMFLYSLWKFYIGENLRINNNIMLDVEALTIPFDVFYRNCFIRDEKENDPSILQQFDTYNETTYKPVEYTPYLFFL